MEVSVTSCVHGYLKYQEIWMPFIGEALFCGNEDDNEHDRYAVAIQYNLMSSNKLSKFYFWQIN